MAYYGLFIRHRFSLTFLFIRPTIGKFNYIKKNNVLIYIVYYVAQYALTYSYKMCTDQVRHETVAQVLYFHEGQLYGACMTFRATGFLSC